MNPPPPIDVDHPQDVNPEDNHSESTQQPDQEPENNTPQGTTHPPTLETDMRETNNNDDNVEPTMFTSTDIENLEWQQGSPNLAWRCEFEMDSEPTTTEQLHDPLETWIMLATSAKKQRTEVRLSELNAEEKQQFEKAKDAEVQNWLQTGTLSKVLRNQIPEEQILRCRWILTWKPLDNTGQDESNPSKKTHKAKARLIVLGYLDPKIEEIPRDSPTLGRTAKMMILQTVATHGWCLKSFDIKAAFLQGKTQPGRTIAIEPVPELRRAMQMLPTEVGKLNKSAYGLIDAPYLWYQTLVTELEALGFEACPFDACLYVLRSPQNSSTPGKICGILGVHVDDGLGGGNSYFEGKIRQLE